MPHALLLADAVFVAQVCAVGVAVVAVVAGVAAAAVAVAATAASGCYAGVVVASVG